MSLFLGQKALAYQQAVTSVAGSAVLVNTNLSIPIAVNQRMAGTIFAPLSVAGAASGAKLQLTVPAAGTLYQVEYTIINGTTNAVATTGILLAAGPFSNALANIATHCAVVNFTIVNGVNGGNVVLQFAQLVADAAAATLDIGAWMEVTKF